MVKLTNIISGIAILVFLSGVVIVLVNVLLMLKMLMAIDIGLEMLMVISQKNLRTLFLGL